MFIVTVNKAYYPKITHFENIKDAEKQAAKWKEEEHESDGEHDAQIVIAKVVLSIPIKVYY